MWKTQVLVVIESSEQTEPAMPCLQRWRHQRCNYMRRQHLAATGSMLLRNGGNDAMSHTLYSCCVCVRHTTIITNFAFFSIGSRPRWGSPGVLPPRAPVWVHTLPLKFSCSFFKSPSTGVRCPGEVVHIMVHSSNPSSATTTTPPGHNPFNTALDGSLFENKSVGLPDKKRSCGFFVVHQEKASQE